MQLFYARTILSETMLVSCTLVALACLLELGAARGRTDWGWLLGFCLAVGAASLGLPEPEETGAGTFVDQICARGRQLCQRCIEVGHLVRDVVHSRPSLRKEAADGSVLAERLEQLDTTFADSDRRGTDTLIVDCRAMLDPRAEQTLVGRESRVEVLDRNP